MYGFCCGYGVSLGLGDGIELWVWVYRGKFVVDLVLGDYLCGGYGVYLVVVFGKVFIEWWCGIVF